MTSDFAAALIMLGDWGLVVWQENPLAVLVFVAFFTVVYRKRNPDSRFTAMTEWVIDWVVPYVRRLKLLQSQVAQEKVRSDELKNELKVLKGALDRLEKNHSDQLEQRLNRSPIPASIQSFETGQVIFVNTVLKRLVGNLDLPVPFEEFIAPSDRVHAIKMRDLARDNGWYPEYIERNLNVADGRQTYTLTWGEADLYRSEHVMIGYHLLISDDLATTFLDHDLTKEELFMMMCGIRNLQELRPQMAGAE